MFANLRQLAIKRLQITVISLEGQISSGKTTFLKRLNELYPNEFVTVQEPVDEWVKPIDGDMSMLMKYYTDTDRFAGSFQLYALITRIKSVIDAMEKMNTGGILVFERSPISDLQCFCKVGVEDGKINKHEYEIYRLYYEFFMKYIDIITPDIIVYLRVTPEIAMERLLIRKRKEEVGVTMEYLTKLHHAHEKMYKELPNGIYKILIDAEKDFKGNNHIMNDIINDILEIVNKIKCKK